MVGRGVVGVGGGLGEDLQPIGGSHHWQLAEITACRYNYIVWRWGGGRVVMGRGWVVVVECGGGM